MTHLRRFITRLRTAYARGASDYAATMRALPPDTYAHLCAMQRRDDMRLPF